MLLEICANSLESALNAQRAGADRIEICAELGVGGISPSPGTLISLKEQLDIPIHVLLRPRSGHFVYSELEFEVIKADVRACSAMGLDGIVTGLLNPDFSVDLERTRTLIDLAGPMHFTFHRAFDWVRDPLLALGQLEDLGVATVLTSGGRARAEEGLENLALWQGRTSMAIMAGGGVNAENVQRFAAIGLQAVHASATRYSPGPDLSGKIPMEAPVQGPGNRVATSDLELVAQLAKAVKIT